MDEKIEYLWAENKLKLERAIKAAQNEGDLSEENVKANYLKFAGRLIPQKDEPKPIVKSAIQIDNSDEENEEKPLSPLAKAALKRKAKVNNIPPLPDDNIPDQPTR